MEKNRLEIHRYVISNTIITSLFFSVFLGLIVFGHVLNQTVGISNTYGGLIMNVILICTFTLFALTAANFKSTILINKRVIYFAWIYVFIFFQGVGSSFFYGEFDFSRFLQSYIVLYVYLLGIVVFSEFIRKISKDSFHKVVLSIYYVLLISIIISLLGYNPFGSHPKSSFFFGEPSHFALSFLPFCAYFFFTRRSKIQFVLMLGLIISIGILIENLVILLGYILIVFLKVDTKSKIILLGIATIGIVLFGTISQIDELGYYTSRLNFNIEENKNLSVLAYLQGWERAFLNVRDYIVGVGFQNFGIYGNKGEIQDILATLDAEGLNMLDGSCVGTKFIGEFGVFAIVLLLMYLFYFYKKAFYLKENSDRMESTQLFFTLSFLFFFIDLFVRSFSYFAPTTFLFLVAIVNMGSKKANINNYQKDIQDV